MSEHLWSVSQRGVSLRGGGLRAEGGKGRRIACLPVRTHLARPRISLLSGVSPLPRRPRRRGGVRAAGTVTVRGILTF